MQNSGRDIAPGQPIWTEKDNESIDAHECQQSPDSTRDHFVITYFVAGIGSTTLPIYVFSQLRFGATPVLNTIGTLFVGMTMVALVIMHFLQKKSESI